MASEPCPECGEVKANSGALRMHRVAKHGIEAGTCDWCGKPFKRLEVHQRKCKDAPAYADVGAPPPPMAEPAGEPEGPGPVSAEVAPDVGPIYAGANGGTAAPTGRMDRLRAKLWDRAPKDAPKDGAGTEATSVYKGKEKAPKVRAEARKSAATVLGTIWGGGGTLLVNTGADVPVGRVLQFQADAAGHILDRFFARTFIDRWVLQRVAQREEDATDMLALIGLPLSVGVYERAGDEARRTLEPIMRQAAGAAIMSMGPAIKARQADEKKMAEMVAELVRQGVLPADLPPGPSGVPDYPGAVLDLIFAPPPGTPPQPQADHEPAPTG